MADNGKVFEKLVPLAMPKGISVKLTPLQASDARIKGKRIAIRQGLPAIEDFNYNLAHELAHAYLHFDKGSVMESVFHEQYEEQADRAARMLLEAITV